MAFAITIALVVPIRERIIFLIYFNKLNTFLALNLYNFKSEIMGDLVFASVIKLAALKKFQ